MLWDAKIYESPSSKSTKLQFYNQLRVNRKFIENEPDRIIALREINETSS